MSEEHKDTITIIGAGFVGLSTAAIFSNIGYKVYLIEINKERLKIIRQGKSFFFEEGIDPLIAKAVTDKSLIPTNDYSEAIPTSHVIFSCVGTPDNPDGSSNLSYVFAAAKEAACLMQPGSIYVQKSTVPVGTGQKVTQEIAKAQPDFSYVSNPEFLREGTALFDALYFDRIVVGGDSQEANQTVLDVYRSVEKNRELLTKSAGIKSGYMDGTYIETNLNGAELVKITANAFLALKISFANNIAKLADQAGADINAIMDAVGADRRIGRAFLNAGRGYGGGCFPKDVSGLIASAEEHGVDMPIMTAASDINESMAGYIANKAQKALGTLKGKKVAVLGLAFKAGTSDARRSPGVKLANILDKNGAIVTTYDPKVNSEAKDNLRKNVAVKNSLTATVSGADAVFIATDWPEFVKYGLVKLAKKMRGSLFIDAVNSYTIDDVKEAGLQYVGVGRNGNM